MSDQVSILLPSAPQAKRAYVLALAWVLATLRGDDPQPLVEMAEEQVEDPNDLFTGMGHALLALATILDEVSNVKFDVTVQRLILDTEHRLNGAA